MRPRSLRRAEDHKIPACTATTVWPWRYLRVASAFRVASMIALMAVLAGAGVATFARHGATVSRAPSRAVSPRLVKRRAAPASSPLARFVGRLRVISYYPAWHPWGGTWTVWQPGELNADMAKIASLDANTVRVFVQPAAFGYPIPEPVYVDRLREMLSIAAAHGLKVWITLFDGWFRYGDLSGSRDWAAAVLTPLRDDPRIAAVELQNEIDPTNPEAMVWAHQMLPVIRTDSGRPVTVSVTGWNTTTPLAQLIAGLRSSQPDFYDLHLYGTPPYMLTTLKAAKRTAHGKPLLIGETGYSTAQSNTSWLGSPATVSVQERTQARYFLDVVLATRALGLPPPGVWTLNDFPSGLLYVTPIQQHFGLYRLDGTAKPAAAIIRQSFGVKLRVRGTSASTRSRPRTG